MRVRLAGHAAAQASATRNEDATPVVDTAASVTPRRVTSCSTLLSTRKAGEGVALEEADGAAANDKEDVSDAVAEADWLRVRSGERAGDKLGVPVALDEPEPVALDEPVRVTLDEPVPVAVSSGAGAGVAGDVPVLEAGVVLGEALSAIELVCDELGEPVLEPLPVLVCDELGVPVGEPLPELVCDELDVPVVEPMPE